MAYLGAAPGMPSDAWDAGQNALRNAKADADNGNLVQARKGLSFALAQKNAMSAVEQARFQTDYTLAVAYVAKPRTQAQIAASKQALADRTKAQEAAVREENARTGGKDPGGSWLSPSSWAYDNATGVQGGFFGTVARALAPDSPNTQSGIRTVLWVGGGLVGVYAFFKMLNFVSEGRRYKVDRERLGVERDRVRALSSNPRRRRRRK